MNIKAIATRYERAARLGLIAVAGLIGLMLVVTWISRCVGHGEFTDLIARYTASEETDEKKEGTKKAKPPEEARIARIKKRDVFSPPKNKKKFNGKLLGVLGDAALFEGDKFVKVGEDYDGAKVTKIGPDFVELLHEDKPMTLYVFGKGLSSSSGPAGPAGPAGAPPTGSTGSRKAIRRAAHRGLHQGFKLTPEMIEQFKQMSPEMREKAFSGMPPELREQLEQAD